MSFETQALSSRGEPRFRHLTKTHSRRTSDEAQSSVYNRKPRARDTAFKETRRESAGPIHRCRGNTKDRCHHRQVSGVSVDDGSRTPRDPASEEEIYGWACGASATSTHRGFPNISFPFQSPNCSATKLLRVMLVFYRSSLLHLNK